MPAIAWERTWDWCGQLSAWLGFPVNRPGYWFFHFVNDEFNFYTSHRSSRVACARWGAQSGLEELPVSSNCRSCGRGAVRVCAPLTSPTLVLSQPPSLLMPVTGVALSLFSLTRGLSRYWSFHVINFYSH